MGNWVKGVFVESAIEPIMQRENSRKVKVKRRGRKPKKVPASEVFIEQTFLDAINGDVKAHKVVLSWSKKYLLPGKKPPVYQSKRHYVTQEMIDRWKEAGAIPSGCAPVLGRLNLADLNRAYRAYKKSQPQEDVNIRAWRAMFRKFRDVVKAEKAKRSTGRGMSVL